MGEFLTFFKEWVWPVFAGTLSIWLAITIQKFLVGGALKLEDFVSERFRQRKELKDRDINAELAILGKLLEELKGAYERDPNQITSDLYKEAFSRYRIRYQQLSSEGKEQFGGKPIASLQLEQP